MTGGFRCNGCAGCWLGRTWRHKTAGTAASIRAKKKIASAALGANLHRRGQLLAGFDAARHLELRGSLAGSAGYRGAQERKIFGDIELWSTRFDYRRDTVYNACTYLGFLEQQARRYRHQGAILIQDNASYHKDGDVWEWFKTSRES